MTPMTFEQIQGKLVAVVLFIEQEGKKDTIQWFAGTPTIQDGKLCFDRGDNPAFCLPLESLEDIRVASEKHRESFGGCEYLLSLTIHEMPEDGSAGMEFTGLTIPPEG